MLIFVPQIKAYADLRQFAAPPAGALPMTLTLNKLGSVLFGNGHIGPSDLPLEEVERCYRFLERFAADKVIYGINTGFGPMAQWRVDEKHRTELQYNLIRSHATGAGNPLPDVYVRAAMAARLGALAQARSGVHPDTLALLAELINRSICPFVPEHGSVGASGDLVQLAHIALGLIGEGNVHYGGMWRPAGEVLAECGIRPLTIRLREGLALTNGTSVMTGIGVVNQLYAERLLEHALLATVWMNEIAESYDDFMAAPLNACRHHAGQQDVAARMRRAAEGSRCLRRREYELYDGAHDGEATFSHKVQGYYSLRCGPQVLGPVEETLTAARRVLEEELNSACDNPIVDPDTENVYHGGNFHGDYISLEEDKVKISIVRLAMLAERQLNYLLHDRINGLLPPFLNLGTPGLNYGMQACQFTATSTTAECQTLAMPNYVHSIPCNNDNQDIVSMGTNSALLCRRVVSNAYQVMAIHFIALAQATDCRQMAGRLAPATRAAYDAVRELAEPRREDQPFYHEIAAAEHWLRLNTILTP